MDRHAGVQLDAWLAAPSRRPLILRGARQVGKTWLIRDLAARSGRRLVEINFEREPRLRKAFRSSDPREVLGELSLSLGQDIDPDSSLLFLDEIQAAGEVLASLRWFYEELPRLPVAAAGSLLEFTLADHSFSMPVGRVSFMRVEPLGFPEYLQAHGENHLLTALRGWRPGAALSPAAHERAGRSFQRYGMVGGMPAAVVADAAGSSPREIRELQKDLVAAYRGDFAKYSGRVDREILDAVLAAVAASLGRKFVNARVSEGVKQHQAKRGLDLLAMAGLVSLIRRTAATGLPLAAEAKDSFRKAAALDVGIVHALLGTPAADAFPSWESLSDSVRGQLAEQLAAQQLRLADPDSQLHYWQREGGRPGEVDFVLQQGGRIVPVELKSGAAGAMKSLHQFVFERGLDLAVRVDSNPPTLMEVDVKTTLGRPVRYRLLCLPHYLLWNAGEILSEKPFHPPGESRP